MSGVGATDYQRSVLSDWLRKYLPDGLLDSPLPGIRFYVHTLALVLLFVGVNYFFNRLGHLPPDAYASASLVPGLVDRLGIALSLAVLVLAGVLLRYGCLWSGWQALDFGQAVRWSVVLLAGLLSWYFVTLGYNYYFDQAYLLERVALLALVPLIYFRPFFVLPFLAFAHAMFWQLDHPELSAGAAYLHKTHLLNVLAAFATVLGIHAVTGSRRVGGFVFVALCLVAIHYWQPAITKLGLDWLNHPTLHFMPLAAYAHGWFAHIDAAEVVAFAKLLEPYNLPMQLYVLGLELAVVLMFLRRWVAVALLVGLSGFHLGVYVLYGYFFWTWIALNVVLLVLAVQLSRTSETIFDTRHAILGAVLVVSGTLWSNPSPLGWHDTRLSYTYRYEVVGESGTVYMLPMRFFAPHGDHFTMANFGYLPTTHKMLVFPYGTTRTTAIAESLQNTRTPAQVFALEASLGRDRHDPERAAAYYDFLVIYMENYNRHGEKLSSLSALRPPAQFQSAVVRQPVFHGQEQVIEIRVYEVTTLFDDTDLEEIRKLELARLPVRAH